MTFLLGRQTALPRRALPSCARHARFRGPRPEERVMLLARIIQHLNHRGTETQRRQKSDKHGMRRTLRKTTDRIVMNTQEQLRQAYEELQEGAFLKLVAPE